MDEAEDSVAMNDLADDGVGSSEASSRVAARRSPWKKRTALGVAVLVVVGSVWWGFGDRISNALGWDCGSGVRLLDDEDMADQQPAWTLTPWSQADFEPWGIDQKPMVEAALATTGGPVLKLDFDNPFPRYADANVLVLEDFNILAGFSTETGDPVWQREFAFGGAVEVDGELVLMHLRPEAGGDVDFMTITPQTGEARSCFRLQSDGKPARGFAAVTGEDLLVSAIVEGGTELIRVDAASGEERWRVRHPSLWWEERWVDVMFGSSVAVVQVDLRGDLRFSLDSEVRDHFRTEQRVLADGGWSEKALQRRRILAVDLATGQPLWDVADTEGVLEYAVQVLDGDVVLSEVFTVDNSSETDDPSEYEYRRTLRARSSEGSVLWEVPGPSEVDRNFDPVQVEQVNDIVVVFAEGMTVGLDRQTGDRLWTRSDLSHDDRAGTTGTFQGADALGWVADELVLSGRGGLVELDPVNGSGLARPASGPNAPTIEAYGNAVVAKAGSVTGIAVDLGERSNLSVPD